MMVEVIFLSFSIGNSCSSGISSSSSNSSIVAVVVIAAAVTVVVVVVILVHEVKPLQVLVLQQLVC